MKEHPILFSGPMVQAILEGRKTQTRRVITPQPTMVTDNAIVPWQGTGQILQSFLEQSRRHACPYGRVGDRLWVRETWANGDPVRYRADQLFRDTDQRWKPSIFMPKDYSRITLEITSVKVERLHEISPAAIEAEGIITSDRIFDGFASLWDKINLARGYGWNVNPWVWVIEFRRL